MRETIYATGGFRRITRRGEVPLASTDLPLWRYKHLPECFEEVAHS